MIFLLGSHVVHVGVWAYDLGTPAGTGRWVPLCSQRRPANDANGLRWPIASTPNENARPVCSRCRAKAGLIAEAVR